MRWDKALVKYFLWRGGLCYGECSVHVSKGYAFLPPARARRGCFSHLHHENLMDFLEINPIKVCPSRLLSLVVCFSFLQYSILSLQPFTNLSFFFYQFLASAATASDKHILAVTLKIHPSVWILGWWFALWPQFSDRSKKICLFLACSAFSYCKNKSNNF